MKDPRAFSNYQQVSKTRAMKDEESKENAKKFDEMIKKYKDGLVKGKTKG